VQLSRVYELLNYGEHGTTVDEVFYSCDVSVLVTGGSSNTKTHSKKASAKKASAERATSTGSLDTVKQLIHHQEKNGAEAADFTMASNAYSKVCVLLGVICLVVEALA